MQVFRAIPLFSFCGLVFAGFFSFNLYGFLFTRPFSLGLFLIGCAVWGGFGCLCLAFATSTVETDSSGIAVRFLGRRKRMEWRAVSTVHRLGNGQSDYRIEGANGHKVSVSSIVYRRSKVLREILNDRLGSIESAAIETDLSQRLSLRRQNRFLGLVLINLLLLPAAAGAVWVARTQPTGLWVPTLLIVFSVLGEALGLQLFTDRCVLDSDSIEVSSLFGRKRIKFANVERLEMKRGNSDSIDADASSSTLKVIAGSRKLVMLSTWDNFAAIEAALRRRCTNAEFIDDRRKLEEFDPEVRKAAVQAIGSETVTFRRLGAGWRMAFFVGLYWVMLASFLFWAGIVNWNAVGMRAWALLMLVLGTLYTLLCLLPLVAWNLKQIELSESGIRLRDIRGWRTIGWSELRGLRLNRGRGPKTCHLQLEGRTVTLFGYERQRVLLDLLAERAAKYGVPVECRE